MVSKIAIASIKDTISTVKMEQLPRQEKGV